MNESNAEGFIWLLFDGQRGFTQRPAQLYPLFSGCKLTGNRKRRQIKEKVWKYRFKRRGKKNFCKEISQSKEQDQQHGIFIMKVEERKRGRIFTFRWYPTSQLEANEQIFFSLTTKWMFLKLYTDTGRIKLVWLGLGRVITPRSRTLHRRAEPDREDRRTWKQV